MNAVFLMLADRMLPFYSASRPIQWGVWDVICIFTAVRECSVYLSLLRVCFSPINDSLRSDLGFDKFHA